MTKNNLTSMDIKIKGLYLSLQSLPYEARDKHAQEVMEDLGITYVVSVPQSMADGWQFYLPENVPDDLPAYLSWFECNPMEKIGQGLSDKMAKDLISKQRSKL